MFRENILQRYNKIFTFANKFCHFFKNRKTKERHNIREDECYAFLCTTASIRGEAVRLLAF